MAILVGHGLVQLTTITYSPYYLPREKGSTLAGRVTSIGRGVVANWFRHGQPTTAKRQLCFPPAIDRSVGRSRIERNKGRWVGRPAGRPDALIGLFSTAKC